MPRIKDVFLYFVDVNGKRWERTPRQMIEALKDAGDEMNYSNYHNGLFQKIEEIIRRYCEEHDIPLGPSKKQREYIQRQKYEADKRLLESGDVNKMLKYFKRKDAENQK